MVYDICIMEHTAGPHKIKTIIGPPISSVTTKFCLQEIPKEYTQYTQKKRELIEWCENNLKDKTTED